METNLNLYLSDVMLKSMKIAYKLWIEKDGKPVFGAGICEIMHLIRETGSLHRAAECLSMSYRAAWGKIREYENILNVELLEKGRHGRLGAQLTEAGNTMLDYYEQIQREIDKVIVDGPVRAITQQMNTTMKAQANEYAVRMKNQAAKKDKGSGPSS